MGAKQLYINGIGTGTYGIYISSDTYLNAPAPDYVAHPIPGRNGDLLQWNKRLNNIARKFTCYIPDQAQSNMDGFKKLLYTSTGYLEISSDYEADTYQRGYLAEEIEAEPFQKDDVLRVTFDLIFSCEPQKYFKTNASETILFQRTSPTRTSYIVPRSHPLIRSLFQTIPPRDVPNDNAYLVQFISPTAVASGVEISNAQFSSATYDGFVAMVVAEAVNILNISKLWSLCGYSTNGVINESSYTYTMPNNTSGVAVVIPADAECTWTATMEQSGGSDFGNTITMQPQGTDTNVHAVGLHYTIEINGEYGQGYHTNTEVQDVQVSMVGLLNGVPSFEGLITVDTKPFRDYTESGQTYQAKIVIDTEDMTGYAEINGETINMSESIGLWGTVDGLADEVKLICYKQFQSNHQTDPFFYQSFKLSPRWWKV